MDESAGVGSACQAPSGAHSCPVALAVKTSGKSVQRCGVADDLFVEVAQRSVGVEEGVGEVGAVGPDPVVKADEVSTGEVVSGVFEVEHNDLTVSGDDGVGRCEVQVAGDGRQVPESFQGSQVIFGAVSFVGREKVVAEGEPLSAAFGEPAGDAGAVAGGRAGVEGSQEVPELGMCGSQRSGVEAGVVEAFPRDDAGDEGGRVVADAEQHRSPGCDGRHPGGVGVDFGDPAVAAGVQLDEGGADRGVGDGYGVVTADRGDGDSSGLGVLQR